MLSPQLQSQAQRRCPRTAMQAERPSSMLEAVADADHTGPFGNLPVKNFTMPRR